MLDLRFRAWSTVPALDERTCSDLLLLGEAGCIPKAEACLCIVSGKF